MAMRGKGYLKDISLKSFMKSMPLTEINPNYGFVGEKSTTRLIQKKVMKYA